jgi:EAL domain-containing protein (putative c-di-GMP-specific phosphodiesterase class I)
MNISLVAEGVETEDHVTMLQGLGCPMAQGYYFAAPMPADEVAQYLARDPARIAHPSAA